MRLDVTIDDTAKPLVVCEDARVPVSLRARSTLAAWGGAKAEAG